MAKYAGETKYEKGITLSSKNEEDVSDEQQEQIDKALEDSEKADSKMLSKYTDPTQNFVTDAFCAQMCTPLALKGR